MAPHLPKSVHFVPAHPVAGTEYSGPDAGFAELFVNRWCILTPPAGRRRRTRSRSSPRSGALLGANVETMPADHHDLVLAHHQPSAASDRLHHRRHRRRTADGDALGSAEILRRRLPRLHPHRRLRPDHVARRVPRQQGRGAGNARPLQRGRLGADHARSAAATARRCSSISRARAPSAAASSRSARIRRRRISAARIPTCRTSRCRSPMRRTRIRSKTAAARCRAGSARETSRRR